MNNDNKVFANKIDKKINNNSRVYYSNIVDKSEEVHSVNHINKNVNQKINEIFNSRSYIYKADVTITTSKGTMNKRLVGKNSHYLITSNNELIPIVDVIDIKYQ